MVKRNTKLRKAAANKKIVNIDELNAFRVAYGNPLGYREYFNFIGLPAIGFAGLSFIIMYKWWFSIIMGLLGAIYGAKVFLPKSVDKRYQNNSFTERNKFINNMTQILTDEDKTVGRALDTVRKRARGEFQEDLNHLQARILGANNKQVQSAVRMLNEKYQKDIIFIQYMEQIETALIEGNTNIDTLKDIKNYHNDIKKKQQYYETQKEQKLNDLKKITISMLTFVVMITFFLGLENYIILFTNSLIGWITSIIFLILEGRYFITFFKYYFDDSITEVSV